MNISQIIKGLFIKNGRFRRINKVPSQLIPPPVTREIYHPGQNSVWRTGSFFTSVDVYNHDVFLKILSSISQFMVHKAKPKWVKQLYAVVLLAIAVKPMIGVI